MYYYSDPVADMKDIFDFLKNVSFMSTAIMGFNNIFQ